MRPARCPAARTDCPAARADCPAARAGIDPAAADLADLAEVLTVLEDFLLHADTDIVDQLTGYPRGRPDDPPGWVRWVADLLGQHAATLRRLDAAATSAHTPIGEPS